jgi:hypothetical protein
MNCQRTGAVVRTTSRGLTPSTAMHNTQHLPCCSPKHQTSQCPFLNIYQPFSNYGMKTKAIACLTPRPGTTDSAKLLAFLFESTKFHPSAPASEQIKLLVLWLHQTTPHYINSPFHSPASAQRHQNMYEARLRRKD